MAARNCARCGASFQGDGDVCAPCARVERAPAAGNPGAGSSGAEAVSIIIPYKNPKALVGYYLGVFSLIPVAGLLLGPAAMVLGVLGLRDRRRNPQLHGLGHAITALVLGGIATIYHLVAVVLIVIAVIKG
jgi:hypothetical protein